MGTNDKTQAVIEAAQRVCHSIDESTLDDMISTYAGIPGITPGELNEFSSAMTDLGMAVQDYEDNGN